MWGKHVKSHISLWCKMFIFHATHLLIKAWKIGAYKWRGLFIEVEDRLPYFITKLLSSFCLKTSNSTYLYDSSYCSKTNSPFLIFVINTKRDSDWTVSVHPFPISFMFRNQKSVHSLWSEDDPHTRAWYRAQTLISCPGHQFFSINMQVYLPFLVT